MEKDYSYVQEKLFNAVYTLAVGEKDVRYRLVNAHLACHMLCPDDFPAEFQNDWKWVVKQLTKHGPLLDYKGEPWRGSVENTMRIIKNKTGSKIAKKIFDLYCELNKEKYF